MLKYYDPNFRGVHVVRATFMAWDYVGHVAWPIGGNCRGAAMLDTDFLECDTQEDIDRYVENDCGCTCSVWGPVNPGGGRGSPGHQVRAYLCCGARD